ncbi:AAA family ATPase [Pseudarthrobacter sp. NPDC092424]|uniref:AAA family ATPase n=1 Tax=Pseudarthrobacter sp. NPDC092424 TaxID=3364415 RepID=UPI0037FF7854
MRIHSLRISGFGPFAGTEEIDFDRLSAHGLFLLNGPTGAGKTSVLDAICFALYGSVPGARQEGKRLRSDHADPSREPAVTCVFSAQGRRFEVTRSPAWDKPSARGRNGFTTQQAKTLLRERIGADWKELSARNDEAGAEIMAVLGMDREQFTRVVMLPQGDFAAFLRSKATDRLELLQKLFGTQRFEAVEQDLVRQAQLARQEVAAISGQLAMLAGRAESEAAALGLDAAEQQDTGAEARLAWLQQAAVDRLAALEADADEAGKISRGRVAAAEAEEARTERGRRLRAASVRKAAVEAGGPELEGHLLRLARHRQAEVLAGQLHSVDAAAAKVRAAAGAAGSSLTLLRVSAAEEAELAGLELRDSAGLPANAAAELGRLRSLQAVVEARLPDEERLQSLRGRQAGLVKEQEKLAAALTDLGRRAAELQGEQDRLLEESGPLEQRAAAAPLLAKEARDAKELLEVVRRYRRAAEARDAVKARWEESRSSQLEAKQVWLDLREERLANTAAELAASLADGAPCPVCGSAAHPDPAKGRATGPGLAQQEEDARQAYEDADAAHSDVARSLAEAEQLVAVLAGRGGDAAEEQAAKDCADAVRAADDAALAAEELETLRSRLGTLKDDLDAASRSRQETDKELARSASAGRDLAEQQNALNQALAELRAGHPSLARRLRSLGKAVAVLDQAVEAHAVLAAAEEHEWETTARLDLALPAAGFNSAAEVRGQLLDAPSAAALQEAVRTAQDEAARVAELFDSEDIVLALDEQAAGFEADPQRLERLRAEAAEAVRAARDAEVAAGVASRCLTALQAITTEYHEAAGACRGPAERAQMLAGLAEAASGRGENTYRMSLNSYVLAARLEQVAVAASERLVAMSDGRYLLQHTDARAARGAKSGLGLEVVDQWTGHRRDTSTLSGGESFMASLSLALGLADVVQQESGGVEIETLFVDEGFGSLDEQSLEQVMDALEGLRDGGRVVGLVSHVAEMKQRIGTQLQVLKGRNGSTLQVSEVLEPAA